MTLDGSLCLSVYNERTPAVFMHMECWGQCSAKELAVNTRWSLLLTMTREMTLKIRFSKTESRIGILYTSQGQESSLQRSHSNGVLRQAWAHRPVVLPTQEAEAERWKVQGQPRHLSKILSENIMYGVLRT